VQISDYTGAALTTRGSFFPPGKTPQGGERKLYLVIEGETQAIVEKAMSEVRRLLYEALQAEQDKPSGKPAYGKYSVV
jgi:ATP-dependent RNA helicase DDX46/PRP5